MLGVFGVFGRVREAGSGRGSGGSCRHVTPALYTHTHTHTHTHTPAHIQVNIDIYVLKSRLD